MSTIVNESGFAFGDLVIAYSRRNAE